MQSVHILKKGESAQSTIEEEEPEYKKFSLNKDPEELKARNYAVNEDDSIDIEDILQETYRLSSIKGNYQQNFEKLSLKVDPQQLVANNFQNEYTNISVPKIEESQPAPQIKMEEEKLPEQPQEKQPSSALENNQENQQQQQQDNQEDDDACSQEKKEAARKGQGKKENKNRSRRTRHKRRESFPQSMLEDIVNDFKILEGSNEENISIQTMAQKYIISQSTLIRIYKDWQQDPKLPRYLNKEDEPLGALIDGKRERTLIRSKIIRQLLINNPFLTQKEISDKLFQRNKSKKKVLRSAIIRIMKLQGFLRKKIGQRKRPDNKQQKISFLKELQSKTNKYPNTFYLDEFLFSRYLYREAYWTLSTEEDDLTPTDKFIAQGMIMIALLAPDGNIYWQIRGGNYSNEEYTKLLNKMLKKVNAFKKTSIIILNKNPVRKIQLALDLINKSGFQALRLPIFSEQLSPLQVLFQQIKRRVRRQILNSTENASKHLCDVVNSLQKAQIINIITQTKRIMDQILEEQKK